MSNFLSYSADFLITLASLGAMAYCMVLSRRLSRLTSFDKGLGGAIAVMSSQVDEMKAALRDAKAGTDGAGAQLTGLVQQARDISTELEMMIAACHDFAEEAITTQTSTSDPSMAEGEEVETSASGAPVHDLDVREEEAGTEAGVTPMFGSRRVQAEQNVPAKATVEPLFRRRKAAG